jgi:proton-dependent oligopeptide transporter, POT family
MPGGQILTARHPPGLYILFFAELWERFSFYGMRALLVLYLTKELLFSDQQAYGVYGAYGALVYTTPLIGGWLADHYLGYHRAIILGGLLMALGHLCLSLGHSLLFYIALALLAAGNGLFKPNISTLVGQLYAEHDPRRDAGFTTFYMGINIGALIAPLICGFIGETYGWHYGFGLAGVGMLTGLLVFVLGPRVTKHGLPPRETRAQGWAGLGQVVLLGVAASVAILAVLMFYHRLTGWILIAAGAAALLWLLRVARASPRVERERLLAIFVLTTFSVTFWSFFEQAGSSLNLFADRNVDRSAFGWTIPASLFQSVNPMFVIALAPFFSMLWLRLGSAGREPSTPIKFALAILLLAAGFAVFGLSAALAGADGKTSMLWLLLGYLLVTSGELCLSPVGLAMVTRLAPARLVGALMGVWFLSTAFAHYIAALIAKLTSAPNTANATALPPTATVDLYGEVFVQIALVAGIVGCALLLLAPRLKIWMHQA